MTLITLSCFSYTLIHNVLHLILWIQYSNENWAYFFGQNFLSPLVHCVCSE